MTAAVSIIGALALLMLGWIKLDLSRLADKVDRLGDKVDDVDRRLARVEGWIERDDKAPR